ncbi:zinc-finger [Actinopolyspora alba]|uniref:Zinc-finger n=1 Tax=Actinopolyspora alba TaxID=673379 RepID=A0A1I1UPZ3_9ACTN|nr:zinc finger protein [Actinopolyspora alba]SFD72881.1 zinc-finger [Actinopolyspora alba]
MFSIGWRGPVVWWNPIAGYRHAFGPDTPPRPEQHRDTLCGVSVTLTESSDADWLLPTCDSCMSEALIRSENREQRHRDARRRLHDQFGTEFL